MAVNVVLNGVTYSIPDPGDNGWGQSLEDYFVAQATGLLQKAGGAFTLTAEVDFGVTYGLKSAYFKSRGTTPATAGVVRLANAESISWRNALGDTNLALTVNASNVLTFNGTAVQSALSVSDTTTIDLTLAGAVLSGIVVDASISNAKLATMAQHTFKGNNTGSTTAPLDLTATQLTAELNAMVGDSGSGGTKGLVPAPGVGDATKVLSGAGTYVTVGTGTVTSVALTVPTALFATSPVTGSPVTTTGTLAPTLATQSANTGFFGPGSGSAATPTFRALASADISGASVGCFVNAGISASIASNILTVALKQADGSTNATAASPVYIPFRSATASTGSTTPIAVTGALSLTVGTTASLGLPTATSNTIYIYALNNAGTVELFASAHPFWDEGTVLATTSTTATSNQVMYGANVRANMPIRLLGSVKATWTSGVGWSSLSKITAVPLNKPTMQFVGTCTGQTPKGLGSATAFTLSSSVDPYNGFDGTNTWTAPAAGTYCLIWNADQGTTSASTGNQLSQATILKGGTATITQIRRNESAVGFTNFPTTASGLLSLVAGDTITVNIITNFGTPGTTSFGALNIYRMDT